MNGAVAQDSLRRRRTQSDFSYKFQRLRERIRQAVVTGELSGKLPGERELARQFQVNAKTLSKALTDLAAEGLLSRSIGRGTFVKGTETEAKSEGPWLLVGDGDPLRSPLGEALSRRNPRIEQVAEVASLRPSFLNQFSAVVDLSPRTPAAFVRDLLVRNLPLVIVGREPATYSANTVLLDVAYLGARLGQDLLMAGHRRIAVVETERGEQESPVARAVRGSISRYAPEAALFRCSSEQAIQYVEQGVTALVCDSTGAAHRVVESLSEASISVPRVASVAAVGLADGDYPCTGFYLGSDQQAEAIIHLLQHGRGGGSGAVLWLTGKYIDTGSVSNASAPAGAGAPVLTLTA
jgi:regulatory GntR family protein/substrate-binding family protein